MPISRTIAPSIARTISSAVEPSRLAWEQGGGVPWSPLADPTALVYLDARYGVDATSVGTWTSRVGSIALSQGTGTAKPTQGASANWGGRTVLTFDGGDYLQNAAISAINTPVTVYAAARADVAAGTGWAFDLHTRCSHYQASSAWRSDVPRAVAPSLVGGASTTSPQALCLTCGGDTQAVALYTDGFVTADVSSTATLAHAATKITVGAYDDGTLKFTGDVAFVVVATGIHTQAQREQYRAWITSEWGIA